MHQTHHKTNGAHIHFLLVDQWLCHRLSLTSGVRCFVYVCMQITQGFIVRDKMCHTHTQMFWHWPFFIKLIIQYVFIYLDNTPHTSNMYTTHAQYVHGTHAAIDDQWTYFVKFFNRLCRGTESDGFLETQEKLIRSVVKSFPYLDSQLLQQIVKTLASVEIVRISQVNQMLWESITSFSSARYKNNARLKPVLSDNLAVLSVVISVMQHPVYFG